MIFRFGKRHAVTCKGSFRAAALVAASGLEDRLKTAACVAEFNSYDNLTDSAFGVAGACGPDPVRALALKGDTSLSIPTLGRISSRPRCTDASESASAEALADGELFERADARK